MVYETLLENSLKETSNLINEEVTAEYYQTMIGNILKDKIRYGLFYNIADVQTLKQPLGAVFARVESTDDAGNISFEIQKTLVNIQTHKVLTNISQEGLEDLLQLSTYNNTEVDNYPALFENFVKTAAGHKEVTELLKIVKDTAVQKDALTITGTEAEDNGETNIFFIQKYVNELILQMNSNNFRTYDAFCLLPQKNVGGILGLGSTYSKMAQQTNEIRAVDYYLTTINNVKYYLNPDKTETNAIIGLHSSQERGCSALIYSPFSILTTNTTNPDNGERVLGIFVRSGLAINPLHSTENPLLMKFEIK